MKYEITSIDFIPGGVAIRYMTDADIRVGGKVVQQHTVQISGSHPDYGTDIDLLADQAERLLRNALEDWRESPIFTPEVEDDDDEPDGMGMGT